MSTLKSAILIALLGAAAPVLAEQITCESQDQQNQVCTTLQPGSQVRMVEQLSRSPCIEGRTWGSDEGHIWVSGGCRATFDVQYERAAYDERGDRGDERQYARAERRDAARESCIQAASSRYGSDDVRAEEPQWIGEGQFMVRMHTPNGRLTCRTDRSGNVESLDRSR